MKTIKVKDLTLSMRGQTVYGRTYPNKNKTARPSRKGLIVLDEIHIYSNGNIKTGSSYLREDDDLTIFETPEEYATYVRNQWKANNRHRLENGRQAITWEQYRAWYYPDLDE